MEIQTGAGKTASGEAAPRFAQTLQFTHMPKQDSAVSRPGWRPATRRRISARRARLGTTP